MNLHNSKLFGSRILSSTTENNMFTTSQETRIQQSHAMFSDLNKNQFQRCEEDYVKNQYMLRNYYGQENSLSKSNTTGEADLTFGLVFSPNDGLQFPNSPDENASTRDEIFVFSVRNIEKIAQFLNLNCDKLKDLFVKIINDEEVNSEFLTELNSKMSVDENVTTQCDEIDLQNSGNMCSKNQVFNQSTQTNEEYVQEIPSAQVFNQSIKNNLTPTMRTSWTFEQNLDQKSESIQVRSPSALERNRTPIDLYPSLNLRSNANPMPTVRYKGVFDQFIQPLDQFIQLERTPQSKPILENQFSINLSQDPRYMSSQLLTVVDALLHKNKPNNCVLTRNTNSGSPDLFSDESDDDCIEQS